MKEKKNVICEECGFECSIEVERDKEISYCPVCGEDNIYVVYEIGEENDEKTI